MHFFRYGFQLISCDGRQREKPDDGSIPLFELWTEIVCRHRSWRGWIALFRAYLHAKHALLVVVVILEESEAYMRIGCGVVQGRGPLTFPLASTVLNRTLGNEL